MTSRATQLDGPLATSSMGQDRSSFTGSMPPTAQERTNTAGHFEFSQSASQYCR